MSSEQPIGFLEGDFNASLFQQIVANASPGSEYVSHVEIPFSDEHGHVSQMSTKGSDATNSRVIGFRAFSVRFRGTMGENAGENSGTEAKEDNTNKAELTKANEDRANETDTKES